jgi:uncharacterized protein YuzE
MTTPRRGYFAEEDILHIALTAKNEVHSVEVSPNIIVELNTQGELIGVEILEATSFIRDFVLESVQARLLQLPQLQAV